MISTKLRRYLSEHHTQFREIRHPHSETSLQSAELARVPGSQLAKAVILEDAQGPLMAVIPADYHIDLDRLRERLGRDLEFADEGELATMFPDCELGAVPPLGPAYRIPTVWDTDLGNQDTLYLEAGDHQTLLQLSGRDFHELMVPAQRGHFSHHA
jgi:Ala-tRNA(Pro) deacylase